MDIHTIAAALERIPMFTAEESEAILRKCANATPQELSRVGAELDAIERDQQAMLRKMIEADPDFSRKLGEFLQSTVKRLQEEDRRGVQPPPSAS